MKTKILILLMLFTSAHLFAQDDAELAKKTQNPLSDLISLPFQNNTSFGLGPNNDRVSNVLNIQPVIPIGLGEKVNLITRTIIPIVSLPDPTKESEAITGLGDILFTAWFSPKQPKKVIWGVGPVISFPTATDDALGSGEVSLGPSVVLLSMSGKWVYGMLINNLWSVTDNRDSSDVNQMLLQYFINYNLPNSWYLSSAPIITANWEATSDNVWTVPFGMTVGKIFRIGKLPINCQVGAFYNVVTPEGHADWSTRIQVQFLFPK